MRRKEKDTSFKLVSEYIETKAENVNGSDEDRLAHSIEPNRHQQRSIDKQYGDLKHKFVNGDYTLKEFYSDIMSVCDINPVGQRPSTVHMMDYRKSASIIAAIFQGIDIGKITLCTNVPDSLKEFESVDGGHRKRALKDFINDLFAAFIVDGTFDDGEPNGSRKKFSELSESELSYFWDYGIIVTTYGILSNTQKAEIFQTINKTTPVNHQQMLNALGNTPIANLVRGKVREYFIEGVSSNNEHGLFVKSEEKETVDKVTGKRKVNKNRGQLLLSAKQNNTLALEEFVARLLWRIFDNNMLGSKSDKELEQMYNTDYSERQVKLAEKELDAHLDFLEQMAIQRKKILGKPITWNELNCISNVYFYLNEEYDTSWTVVNPRNFFKKFKKSFDYRKNKSVSDNLEGHGLKYEKAGTDVKETFKNFNTVVHFSEHKDYPNTTKVALRQSMEWLYDVKVTDGIHTSKSVGDIEVVYLDKNRLFSTDQKELMLSMQDFKCAIDGEDLLAEDAEADHVIPYSKGGETEISNGRMIRRKYNKQKGNKLTLEEVREMNGIV